MRDFLAGIIITLLAGIIIPLFFLQAFVIASEMGSAKELKLKYSIEEPGFIGVIYYTNSYKIDSIGCVSFRDELDSSSVILCGSYKIETLN